MTKKFEFKLEIQSNNTPQNWKFENVNPLEQLAVWMMVKDTAEKNIAKMLNGKQ